MSRYTLTLPRLLERQDPSKKKLTDSHHNVEKDWTSGYASIHASRVELPVYKEQDRLLQAVKNPRTQVIVISAATGSGKTLQSPQVLAHIMAEDGIKEVAILTQPRIIAAREVADRLSVEMDSLPGKAVTLQTSQDHVIRKGGVDAWINVMTDGLLVAKLQSGDIDNARFVIIDEVHERSENMDTCMGAIKPFLRARPELQLVLMSATGQDDVFLEYFAEFHPELVTFPGRPQHIDDIFLDETNEQDWAHCMTRLVRKILIDEEDVAYKGDILAFCPGKAEIDQMLDYLDLLRQESDNGLEHIKFCTLYRDMPASEQRKVLQTEYVKITVDGKLVKRRIRKIILATNIAETSITLPDLDWVIDSGYSKVAHYLPEFDARELVTCRCSWAQCWQRRGRVGRKRRDMKDNYTYPLPPVLRSDLTSMMLKICATPGGFSGFDWIVQPTDWQLARANDNLMGLGFLQAGPDMKLTEQGKLAAKLSMDPFHAKLFLGSKGRFEVIALVALLEYGITIRQFEEETRAGAKQRVELFEHANSDHLTELELFLRWKEHQVSKTDLKFARKTYINWVACRLIDQRIEELRKMWKNLNGSDLVEFTPSEQLERVKLLSMHLLDAYALKLAVQRKRPGAKQEGEDDTRYWVNVRMAGAESESQPLKLRFASIVKNFPYYLIYTSLEYRSGTGKLEMERVTAIEEDWLREWDPEFEKHLVRRL